MAKVTFKIEGMKELERAFKKLGDVPQKVVTPAARKGMRIVQKDAKKNAPEDLGTLKDGIILVGERSRLKGKKVYQVVFDRRYNHVFQKPVKNPSPGRSKIAYYPASMEYGYYLRNGQWMPGFHFLKNAIQDNEKTVRKVIVDELFKGIDKAWR